MMTRRLTINKMRDTFSPSQQRTTGQFGFERKPATKRSVKRFEYVFKLVWRSTAKTIKVLADDEEEARKRLDTIIKRTEGGSCLEAINLTEIREA